MTGLERNAGVVTMASYAPLLAHVDAWQWRPDLIWFDNLSVIGTPNYYVQKLFSTYRGTHVINAFRDGKAVNGGDSLYASAAIDRTSGRLFIRIVNTSSTEKTLHFTIEGTRVLDEGQMEVLRSDKLSDFNSVNEPKKIYPSVKAVRLKGGKLDSKISSWSVNVIVLGIKG
jgi:alpha-L-arabinofuranosidase